MLGYKEKTLRFLTGTNSEILSAARSTSYGWVKFQAATYVQPTAKGEGNRNK
ncbi:hypothetical protein ZHAS_00011173 [Anopheles sinensis]|uniref:Uncharacterized protein n=1 Tax=Anopheles sinensis TaxID=74873 RepID=A0A084VZH7_ANOSI|nr:hypothetical protein ZHAS_00011173 [Anopheles sinensis]